MDLQIFNAIAEFNLKENVTTEANPYIYAWYNLLNQFEPLTR